MDQNQLSSKRVEQFSVAAARAAAAAEWDQVCERLTEALELSDIPTETEFQLRKERAWANEMLLNFASARKDLERMIRLAEALDNVRLKVSALIQLGRVVTLGAQYEDAYHTLTTALRLAQEAELPELVVDALAERGTLHRFEGDTVQTRQDFEAALTRARDLNDSVREVNVLNAFGHFLATFQGESEQALAYGEEALALSRRIGYRLGEARAFQILGLVTPDLAQKRAHYEQALVLYMALGYRVGQAIIYNNLAITYVRLGLYNRGIANAQLAIRQQFPAVGWNFVLTLARCYLHQGAYDAAREALETVTFPMSRDGRLHRGQVLVVLATGVLSLAQGDASAACEQFKEVFERLSTYEIRGTMAAVLTWWAAAELASDDYEAALEHTALAITWLDFSSIDSPQFIWWWRYRALTAMDSDGSRTEEAWQALDRACQVMLQAIASLSDEGLRRNFLNKVADNREITLTWAREATRRGQSLVPFTERQPASTNVQEQLKRMVDVGTRLASHREPDTLLQFLIQEFVELSGAERAFLYLWDEDGTPTIASDYTQDEEALLAAQALAEPLIEAVQLNRQPILRQDVGDVPAGDLPEIHLRSLIVLPLISQGKLLGMLYGDMRHIFGRFTAADLDLLGLLANQAASALENVHWMQSLEAKVAQRTADLQTANEHLEQRNSELAIINSVQEGLVAELDMQAIYDLVGDQIRDVFDAQSTSIATYDLETMQLNWRYISEKGQRFYPEPSKLGNLDKELMRTRQPLLINVNEDWKAYGAEDVEGTFSTKSGIFVPLIVGETVRGRISLQSIDHEYAFDESDVKLLSTLANSMSLALENARLFSETQRLLEETEQRAAELAIINSVQEGLVAELDMQAIYELVGDQIRQVFDAQAVMIGTFDLENETVYIPYLAEKGERFDPLRGPYSGLHRHLIETRQLVLINENARQTTSEYGMKTASGTEEPRSLLFVPLLVGDKTRGFISLQNVDREHAFSDADVRLLSTLANSMSLALENARHFSETQRLLEVTEQRAAELAIINSVQEGLAAELNMQAIYDLVGDQIRDVFDAQAVGISTHDLETMLVHPVYFSEKGQRFYPEPWPAGAISKELIRTRQPLLINTRAEFQAYDVETIEGTELTMSGIFVPLIVGETVRGSISLWSIDREYAFDESDVQLLSTLANSMSLALENARLFAETQRLLEETEQRAAELAIINSVQAALAAELNMQTIYELVGDQIRDVFDAQATWIATVDSETMLMDSHYVIEKGQRYYPEPLRARGAISELMRTRQLVLINTIADWEPYGIQIVEGTEMPKSAIFVPLLVGETVRGMISLQNIDRDYAFDESDVRLLSTLANSMSLALENARLFAETQRRVREMSALAEVGRDISATLDLPTVLERIASHARELLDTSDSAVFLPDANNQFMTALVALGPVAEQVRAMQVRPGVGILGDLWLRAEAEVINEANRDPRAITIPGTEEDSDDKMMVAPLLSGDRVTGMMAVWRTGGNSFNEADLNFLVGLARQAAIAIENARLFTEAEMARAAAEEANESKSAFLANVSHELRTPLTSILGFARIVQRRFDERILPLVPMEEPRARRTSDQIQGNLEIILAEGERLTTLVNNVLDLEKIEAGRMDWEMAPVSVAEIIEQGTAATRALVEQKGLSLVEEVAPELSPATGDRDKLVQVILNLISNAMKFTDTGTITCRAEARDGEIVVSVSDTGVGIAEEDLPVVFEKFKQVGDTLTDKPKGTGLGLAICKEIIEHHGGRIWVESTLGEGSTFYFTLPLPQAEASRVVETTAEGLLQKLKKRLTQVPASEEGLEAGKKVLVVDDDSSIREFLRQELAAEGYVVHEASTGREALAQVKAVRPDLVILDVLMPGLNGFDVAAVIKNDPETMELPIMVVSVLEDQERGYRLGVDRYLTKPIDVPTLLDEIKTLLKQGVSRRKVLVIDEDASMLHSLTVALEAQGYQVTTVVSGEAAIERAVADRPDMIIADWLISTQHDLVQVIRFEKGLENVLFLLMR